MRLGKQIALCLLPFLLVGLVMLTTPLMVSVADSLPECPFHTYFTDPSCGLTRSVLALIQRGDVLESLRFNAMPVTLLLFVALVYSEQLCAAFGKRVRLFPHTIRFLIAVAAVFVVYFVVRNFIPGLALHRL